MKFVTQLLAACAFACVTQSLLAQQNQNSAIQNVVQLASSGVIDIQQDILQISMTTTRDGFDPVTVQSQLKMAVDLALTEAKKQVQTGQMDVRTGQFNLYPRYGRDGKTSGWQGSAELILEGRDFVRITSAAGKIQSLTVANVSFGLSREQRLRVESEAQALAIDRFKSRAMDIARSFGFSGYSLREVNVIAQDQGFTLQRPRLLAVESRAAAVDAALPVEAGKIAVTVTVSGSVQLK